MMGTGPFAWPTFERLLAGPHQVVGLVTQPLRAGQGRREAVLSPVRSGAVQRGVAIQDPVDINSPEARQALAAWQPDLLVVADYGQILRAETLAVARHGGVNLHGSLLPKYRGAAPIHWALWHGETETGVSVIHMTPQLDAGPVLAQAKLEILPHETTSELEQRLAALGAPLVESVIEQLARGETQALPQDPALASRARRLRKADGEIDWQRSAQDIHNQIRALDPWPKAFTFWHRPGEPPLRIIVVRAHPELERQESPGLVLAANDQRLVVAAGRGALVLESIQPAGKRLLQSGEFLRGYPVAVGQRFGPAGAGTDPQAP